MNSTLARRAAIVICIALSACSGRPPTCDDESTRKTAEKIILDLAQQMLQNQIERDSEGLMKVELANSHVALKQIVDEGYRGDSKKQICRATMTISAPTSTIEGPINYSTQMTVDDKSAFLMEIENAQEYAARLGGSVQIAADRKAGLGRWEGTYTCEAATDAESVPDAAAFSTPVTMIVSPEMQDLIHYSLATLERRIGDGASEKLTGTYMTSLDLKGGGSGPGTQRWRTSFSLTLKGRTFAGEGKMRGMDGRFLRNCSVELTHVKS